MIIGITYDLREDYLAAGYSLEETAEFDKPETIDAIENALLVIGFKTDRIGHVKNFKGIELAVISGNGNAGFWSKMKSGLANALAGGDMGAITIIGPATVVKEMKKNPKKIELLLNR